MNYSQMKDERLLAFYENVRQQVILYGNGPHRRAGEGVRTYTDERRLRYMPIDGPNT